MPLVINRQISIMKEISRNLILNTLILNGILIIFLQPTMVMLLSVVAYSVFWGKINIGAKGVGRENDNYNYLLGNNLK